MHMYFGQRVLLTLLSGPFDDQFSVELLNSAKSACPVIRLGWLARVNLTWSVLLPRACEWLNKSRPTDCCGYGKHAGR
jgi:hypothetical protein